MAMSLPSMIAAIEKAEDVSAQKVLVQSFAQDSDFRAFAEAAFDPFRHYGFPRGRLDDIKPRLHDVAWEKTKATALLDDVWLMLREVSDGERPRSHIEGLCDGNLGPIWQRVVQKRLHNVDDRTVRSWIRHSLGKIPFWTVGTPEVGEVTPSLIPGYVQRWPSGTRVFCIVRMPLSGDTKKVDAIGAEGHAVELPAAVREALASFPYDEWLSPDDHEDPPEVHFAGGLVFDGIVADDVLHILDVIPLKRFVGQHSTATTGERLGMLPELSDLMPVHVPVEVELGCKVSNPDQARAVARVRNADASCPLDGVILKAASQWYPYDNDTTWWIRFDDTVLSGGST